ncbi:hypothetical protein AGATL06_24380 [Agathobaculum sp. TL06]
MIDTAHYTAGSAGRTSPYEADRTNRNTEAIRELLFRLGVTAKYKGCFYAIYAVTLCMEEQELLLSVTKRLYPEVARKYKTNWKAVERNIRTVSAAAWSANRRLLEALANRPLDRYLYAAEFISVIWNAVLIGSIVLS